MAPFRDTYKPTSRKYNFTEPKTRPFQYFNKKYFRSHSNVFKFQKQWYFHSNSAKTTLSNGCGDSFQRNVCTNFQKICFYRGKDKNNFRSFQNKIISVVKEKKILGPTTTFLDFKNSDIFIQILPKRPYQMPVVARFRDTYARTSWKYVSTESKIRSSQKLHKIFFIFHFSVFRFQKQWYFHSNSAKTTLSDTCVGSFQRHVCTDFQKICFYWA